MDHCGWLVRSSFVGHGDLLGKITKVFDFWFNPPVPIVLLQKLMLVEEAAIAISGLRSISLGCYTP